MAARILYIGGSPCSGKSTIAELIEKDFGAYYFKVDDFLNEFIGKASACGKPACSKLGGMTPEDIWMRSPAEQCEEEFQIYDEIAPFVFEKLSAVDKEAAELIITEGAAFTPQVMERVGFKDHICMVPEPEFQISHYRAREWVPYVLEGCSDKGKAFDNWMQRDILFAKQVMQECEKKNIPCIVNNGTRPVGEMYEMVKQLFGI